MIPEVERVWKCRLVPYREWTDLEVGDMFFGPLRHEADDPKWDTLIRLHARNLSNEYWAERAGQRPLFVIVPGLSLFCIDGQQWDADAGGPNPKGWSVVGKAPELTVSPSINLGGVYHGWLVNGVLSSDCEGRKYDEEGFEIRC